MVFAGIITVRDLHIWAGLSVNYRKSLHLEKNKVWHKKNKKCWNKLMDTRIHTAEFRTET